MVLLSNSPRPSPSVQEQLRRLGVPDDAYDATVTSGDLTRHELAKHHGAAVFHLGPERDRADLPRARCQARTRTRMPSSSSAPGLFDDETETPEIMPVVARARRAQAADDLRQSRSYGRARRPLGWCAGALAQLYERQGGQVIYAGKPYAPIYQLALETIGDLAGERRSRRTRSSPSATASTPTSPARPESASIPCSWRAGCICRRIAAAKPARRCSIAPSR